MNPISLFLALQGQLKIFHWQTSSFAEHKAFELAYTTIDPLADNFIEVYMGKTNISKSGELKIQYFNYDSKDRMKVIKYYIGTIKKLRASLQSDEDSDLVNISDEVIGSLNKLVYLLGLK